MLVYHGLFWRDDNTFISVCVYNYSDITIVFHNGNNNSDKAFKKWDQGKQGGFWRSFIFYHFHSFHKFYRIRYV
ncbi:hypothetical protein DSM02_4127 [Leeuwenhoekiella polynyae]|uniref:Uncharacterized protein n=1 Tax=Leeuwenhoekiella polynyae TaxID=1550906 RepID=A0A4Q0NN17_9FLAO|nr:hypothetical protein DSM02_4127 [Leeuwenhoekiella polynyae]